MSSELLLDGYVDFFVVLFLFLYFSREFKTAHIKNEGNAKETANRNTYQMTEM